MYWKITIRGEVFDKLLSGRRPRPDSVSTIHKLAARQFTTDFAVTAV